MLEKQQKHRSFGDPHEHGIFADSKLWLNEANHSSSSSSPPRLSSSSAAAPGNVDKVLFKNLVEMVPLVESLMDRRANSSFTRRASVIYTATPSHPKKVVDPKGRKTAQTASAKKRRDLGDNIPNKHINKDNQDCNGDDFSIFSSRALTEENSQKDNEELTMLREQVDDLRNKLLEKDDALKSAENSVNQMSAVYVTLEELRRQVAEKDSLIKSANSQLSNAKIKLADKQAALEKLNWEARTSNRKVEELQGDLDSRDFEITALMQLFEKLSNSDSAAYPDDSITYFHHFDQLPNIDNIDEVEMEKMEAARMAYVAALATAKENPSDQSLAMAAEARRRLQSFVL